MSNLLPQIAWDSCIVIHFLEQTPGHFPVIFPIAKDAEDKKLKIVVSMLTIAETLRITGKLSVDQETIISDFFERPFIHREAVGLFIAERARDIRRKYEVDSADSIHIATAAQTNSQYFLTYDGTKRRNKSPLLKLDQQILLADGSPLRIITPEDYDNIQRLKAQPLLALATDATAPIIPTAPEPQKPNV